METVDSAQSPSGRQFQASFSMKMQISYIEPVALDEAPHLYFGWSIYFKVFALDCQLLL